MAQAKKNEVKRTKCLIKEYSEASKSARLTVDYIMDDRDVGHWWCRLSNIESLDDSDEFRDAEIIVEMFANADHPVAPPRFFVRTPNGVYVDSVKSTADEYNVCLGVGDRHKDEFECANKSMKGMTGFMNIILNGIRTWRTLGPGIGILHSDCVSNSSAMARQLVAEKRALSKLSREYNMRHFPELVRKFDALPFRIAINAIPHLGLDKRNAAAVQRHIIG